jgi:hypothetical protein
LWFDPGKTLVVHTSRNNRNVHVTNPQRHPRTEPESRDESLAGYRVIRTIGSSRDARVFLGCVSASVADQEPQLAALKVFRRGSGRSRADAEVAALTRAQRPHIVALLDYATTSDGRVCLILELLRRGNLAQLLAARETLSPGEVVTALAPIAEAVDGLHDAGVAHGSLSVAAILFDENGAPVLSRFGGAATFTPRLSPAVLGNHPLVLTDRVALSTLVIKVVAHAPDAHSSKMLTWLADCDRHGFPDNFGQSLAEHLYELAEPVPVGFPVVNLPSATSSTGRAVAVNVPIAAGRSGISPLHHGVSAHSGGKSSVGRGVAWFLERLPPAFRNGATLFFAHPLVARFIHDCVSSRLVCALREVRRPVWLASGAVTLALLVFLIVVPSSPSVPIARQVEETPRADIIIEGNDPTSDRDFGTVAAAVADDDPLIAIAALVKERERCIRDMSILCLDAVAQQGSVAMEQDIALIRAVQAGEEVPMSETGGAATMPDAEFSVVERLGDTALVDVTSGGVVPKTVTASLLLMKGEAGWRIRSYIRTESVNVSSP